ncbi:peptidoglycan recognition family protein [Paucibacter sp. PLA-PC-4]|uniref:peptidoglycan recognition protein family protein n=1 Tax=Paucibacter sp. PLA-PC-4 TaxID=2993655 RepID=UPI003A4C6C3E
MHQDINGRCWSDIGYHYLIDLRGRLIEGRQGDPRGRMGLAVGAHCYGYNSKTVGIGILGCFDVDDNRSQASVPLAVLETLGRLRDHVSWHAGRTVPLLGHAELNGSTRCPGKLVADALRSLEGWGRSA